MILPNLKSRKIPTLTWLTSQNNAGLLMWVLGGEESEDCTNSPTAITNYIKVCEPRVGKVFEWFLVNSDWRKILKFSSWANHILPPAGIVKWIFRFLTWVSLLPFRVVWSMVDNPPNQIVQVMCALFSLASAKCFLSFWNLFFVLFFSCVSSFTESIDFFSLHLLPCVHCCLGIPAGMF